MVLVYTVEVRRKDRSLPGRAFKDILNGMWWVGGWAHGGSIPRGDDYMSLGMTLGLAFKPLSAEEE